MNFAPLPPVELLSRLRVRDEIGATMNRQGNHLDVSGRIDVTAPAAVGAEVMRIYAALYPGNSPAAMEQAFRDVDWLYRGRLPGFHACDTPYHDIQHVLDVTLAMARLMLGHERMEAKADRFGAPLFHLGIVTALFHDAGYLLRVDDVGFSNGAQLTLTHVSRGARLLESYLPQIGLGDVADAAASLIHFTGYEVPAGEIAVASPRHRRLGCLLGTADILAQMADRCYLEKCRDRLYPELVAGGVARRKRENGAEEVLFASGDDLVMKTPAFYESAVRRLNGDLDGAHRYGGFCFGGRDLYLDEMERNASFAGALELYQDTTVLKRVPPGTLRDCAVARTPC